MRNIIRSLGFSVQSPLLGETSVDFPLLLNELNSGEEQVRVAVKKRVNQNARSVALLKMRGRAEIPLEPTLLSVEEVNQRTM